MLRSSSTRAMVCFIAAPILGCGVYRVAGSIGCE
jgi:hypothetical protein